MLEEIAFNRLNKAAAQIVILRVWLKRATNA